MQDQIIKILKEAGGYISGQEISNSLGVSRTAVWKNINNLRGEGYVVDSVTNKGYKLVSCPDIVCKDELVSHLRTNLLGRKLVFLDSTGSTNEYAKDLGMDGEPEGTVVIARDQTAGKGRLGRRWVTKKDEGVWFSILLRPKLTPTGISGITPIAGLAVCSALNRLYGMESQIKWPNDVISGNKKLCGILTELSAEMDAIQFAVLGIGINCDTESFPGEIAHKATSVYLETGKKINKSQLIAEILNTLEEELIQTNYKMTPFKVKEYTSHCASIGKAVTFHRGNKQVNGIAVAVNPKCELVVMLNDGTTHNVSAGEVSVQDIY